MRSISRVLLIIFMVTLLPLRGWASEVMATGMASNQIERKHPQPEYAIKLIASNSHINWATAYFYGSTTNSDAQKPRFEATAAKSTVTSNCEGHVEADSTVPADAHCDSCPACQACHTMALSAAAINLNPTFSSRTLPRPAAADFASAIAALGQKPPIS